MTISYTAHLRLPIPDFLQDPWHAELEASIRAIDTALYQAILIQDVDLWLNATVYAIGAIVIDPQTGLMWTCATANTSSASPTTFAQERVANPTYWNATATIPQQRGAWVTATSYIPGDFVVESNRYAVCLVAHVSAAAFNTDLAAARWVVLIDLSSLGVGINATAEGTIASAATTNIGASAPTRLLVTGNTTISSFGVVANTYKILRFEGTLQLTHHATDLILLGAANRNTAAGDIMWVSSDSTGKWRELMYSVASGLPLGVPDASLTVKGIIELATQTEVDDALDFDRAVTPGTLGVRLVALTASILATIRDGVSGTLDTLAEIATAIGLLAPKANPTFTGTATIPTLSNTTATIGTLTVSAGTNLPAGDISVADLTADAKPFLNLYEATDTRSSNTGGDTLSTNAWTKRTLNETVDYVGGSISSSVITLPAGTYYCRAWSTIGANINVGGGGSVVGRWQIRLRNTTAGSTLLRGSSHSVSASDSGSGGNDILNIRLFLEGTVFTLAASQSLELQTWSSSLTDVSIDGGKPANSGEDEMYSYIVFFKIGS